MRHLLAVHVVDLYSRVISLGCSLPKRGSGDRETRCSIGGRDPRKLGVVSPEPLGNAPGADRRCVLVLYYEGRNSKELFWKWSWGRQDI
jgi:hypothetical protein